MDAPFQWFAMRATYKREFVAQEYLQSKGIEVFIPLRREIKVIRGVKRKVTVPAINSLIFVYAQKELIQQAKFGVDYLQYLTRKLDGKNIPIIVPSHQMELFKRVVEDDTIDKTYFAPGEVNLIEGARVKVHGGPLNGYQGILIKQKGKRNKQFFLDV
ncbi:MAG: UpxY family transcription antiterminator, partial [Bacteroidales bacterium]|nr:UpxY family transcription antiterminator [Bacteroidales bacterium]